MACLFEMHNGSKDLHSDPADQEYTSIKGKY